MTWLPRSTPAVDKTFDVDPSPLRSALTGFVRLSSRFVVLGSNVALRATEIETSEDVPFKRTGPQWPRLTKCAAKRLARITLRRFPGFRLIVAALPALKAPSHIVEQESTSPSRALRSSRRAQTQLPTHTGTEIAAPANEPHPRQIGTSGTIKCPSVRPVGRPAT
jgi:hypothetical protein